MLWYDSKTQFYSKASDFHSKRIKTHNFIQNHWNCRNFHFVARIAGFGTHSVFLFLVSPVAWPIRNRLSTKVRAQRLKQGDKRNEKGYKDIVESYKYIVERLSSCSTLPHHGSCRLTWGPPACVSMCPQQICPKLGTTSFIWADFLCHVHDLSRRSRIWLEIASKTWFL